MRKFFFVFLSIIFILFTLFNQSLGKKTGEGDSKPPQKGKDGEEIDGWKDTVYYYFNKLKDARLKGKEAMDEKFYYYLDKFEKLKDAKRKVKDTWRKVWSNANLHEDEKDKNNILCDCQKYIIRSDLLTEEIQRKCGC